MPERLIGVVLKAIIHDEYVGSNPTLPENV